MMDVNLLLDSFSSFGSLAASNALKTELVQTYYLQIKEYLELLSPTFEELDFSKTAANENLESVVKCLDASFKLAKGLIENWHQMTSKLHFVMQMESAINKLQASALETCQLLGSSFSEDSVSKLVEKIKEIHNEQTSHIIKEAMKAQAIKKNPTSDNLDKISKLLSLSSNQELLLEILALDKLKANVARSENHADIEVINQMITLIDYMHHCHVEAKQLHSINGVPIPDDFCCPLSLELMTDPVIVASGQTYEKAFIKQWLDQGFNVCPKTRQALGHTNLIPNYTVKALIANWCDSNDIKLPHPNKSFSNMPSVFSNSQDSHSADSQNINRPKSPDISNIDSKSSDSVYHDTHKLEKEPISLRPNSNGSTLRKSNGSLGSSVSKKESTSEECSVPTSNQVLDLPSSSIDEDQFQGHNRSNSTSNAVSNNGHTRREGDENNISRVSSDLTNNDSSDNSGEVTQDVSVPTSRLRELMISPRLSEARSRRQTSWRRPSERFVPRIISPSTESRPDLSGIETEAWKLVEDLKSDSIEIQRDATAQLRLLARHNMDNRIVIANCGAISLLVGLLLSTDLKTQENAVTALLNLSINDNNKTAIANADCIDPLIHVLETGNPEAKENAAATLFSLSVIEENKVRIGRSRAIKPLVELLGSGTPRGKKDAATALFNLSIFHENKARIVSAGAVKHLVELMEPAAGMVDKAVAVLANLATIPEGRTAIGHERGIPVLVEVVELGSARGKENAAAALLQLCTNSSRFCSQVLQEGAVPPLVALSQSGTARAKEKAQALLSYFRNQRHGGAGRG